MSEPEHATDSINPRTVGEACPVVVADAIHRWFQLLQGGAGNPDAMENVYDELADVLDFAPYTGKYPC